MVEAIFEKEKETKNTVRFAEKTAEGDAPKVGTLYVPRYTLASIGYKDGDVIRITIEAGEAE